jgi:hypothetical protein
MRGKLPFLPDEHHYAIAHVATRAAQLDHAIEFSVMVQMMPHRETAQFLIKGLDINRLIGLLHTLLRENFPDECAITDGMMKDVGDARRERNEILHWLWGKGDDETTAKHGSMRPYRPDVTKTKTAEQIYSVADTMLLATMALHKLDQRRLDQLNIDFDLARSLLDTPEQQAPPEHSASPENPDPPEAPGLLGPQPPPSPKKSES